MSKSAEEVWKVFLISELGFGVTRSVSHAIYRYLRFVKPSYDNFVRPTATYADIVCIPPWSAPQVFNWTLQIVPGSNNAVAIDLISAHIRRQLQERANQFRQKLAIPRLYLAGSSGASTPESTLEDLDLKILPQTRQLQVRVTSFYIQHNFRISSKSLQGIFTILRSRTTSRQDFVFFVDRLSTILVENALQYLPYIPKTVVTPVGVESHGQQLDAKVSDMYRPNSQQNIDEHSQGYLRSRDLAFVCVSSSSSKICLLNPL